MVWATLIYIIGFILIHIFSRNMKFMNVVPRSRFLSLAGGISVAYVFLHLMPELGQFQNELEGEMENSAWAFIESHIYIVAMIGLAIFYGLEVMVKQSKKRKEQNPESGAGVFWVHIISFMFYNSLIGYLLVHDEAESGWGTFFFFIAMGLHFITNDKSLRNTHAEDYDRYGRWMLTAAIAIGWLFGILVEVSDMIVSFLVALLAGGIILNVMKEELPEERESSFLPFVIGMISYSLLLIFI